MNWFSKKKWYIVTWKPENWSRSTYTDIVKATCSAQAAHKVGQAHNNMVFIVKVEEVEEDGSNV